MDVKALLNGKPAVTVGVCVVVIVVGIWFGMNRAKPRVTSPQNTGNYYFTADDGATWKEFSPFSIPPFEDGGKTWVRAHVFQCGKEAPKIGYLEQYAPAIKERLEGMKGNMGVLGEAMEQASARGTQVKRKGESAWVARDAGAAITEVRCGDGAVAKEVFP